MSEDKFSKRFGYSPRDREIIISDDAPEAIRATFLQALQAEGLSPEEIRGEIVCPGLKKIPNPNNWSTGNIWEEVVRLVNACEWFKVYDLVERGHDYLANRYGAQAHSFEEKINECFYEEGIGWQLNDGVIEIRGPEAFESSVRGAGSRFPPESSQLILTCLFLDCNGSMSLACVAL